MLCPFSETTFATHEATLPTKHQAWGSEAGGVHEHERTRPNTIEQLIKDMKEAGDVARDGAAAEKSRNCFL